MQTTNRKPNIRLQRTPIFAILLCVALVVQSLVPASAMAIIAMRCTANGPATVVATSDSYALGQHSSLTTPDCCRYMKLDCPMARRFHAANLPVGVTPSRTPKAHSAPIMRDMCRLTITATGSDRPAVASATTLPVPVHVATSVAPARPEIVSAPTIAQRAWFTRPPPARQCQIAARTRSLRAPPAA